MNLGRRGQESVHHRNRPFRGGGFCSNFRPDFADSQVHAQYASASLAKELITPRLKRRSARARRQARYAEVDLSDRYDADVDRRSWLSFQPFNHVQARELGPSPPTGRWCRGSGSQLDVATEISVPLEERLTLLVAQEATNGGIEQNVDE